MVNFNNCPDYLLWLQYISIFYYSFCLVSINQWKEYGPITCTPSEAAQATFNRCAYTDGLSVLTYFGIDPNDQTRDILIVIAMIFFFRIATVLLLHIKPASRG